MSSTSSTSSTTSSSSTGGSWLDRAKVMASQAADATKKAAVYAADSAKKTYDELKAPPSSIACSGCPNQVEVPSNIFDWSCLNGHHNTRENSQCVTCNSPKPKTADPVVVCSACHASTPVPATNAGKHLKEAAANSKAFVAKTAAATKDQINYLKSNPETFHCAHCNSLLAVPTGPWACQTCTAENPEDAIKCSKCTQKKSEQKAICGVCRQSTIIPTTNFVDGLKATTRDLAKSSTKIYYDARAVPYVSCSRCGQHVPLNENKDGSATPPTSTLPPTDGSAPTDSQQAQIKNLVCPACKNKVEG